MGNVVVLFGKKTVEYSSLYLCEENSAQGELGLVVIGIWNPVTSPYYFTVVAWHFFAAPTFTALSTNSLRGKGLNLAILTLADIFQRYNTISLQDGYPKNFRAHPCSRAVTEKTFSDGFDSDEEEGSLFPDISTPKLRT